MDTRGTHLLIELWGCDPSMLDSTLLAAETLKKAAKDAGATPLHSAFRRFDPQGITGFLMVSESHYSIHTWPEEGYVAIDAYTCGACDPTVSVGLFQRIFRARETTVVTVSRGECGAVQTEIRDVAAGAPSGDEIGGPDGRTDDVQHVPATPEERGGFGLESRLHNEVSLEAACGRLAQNGTGRADGAKC